VADISDVTFLDNSVSGAVDWRAYVMGIAGGGALLVFGSDMGGGASVRVSRCRFESNTVNATDLYPPPSDSSGQGSLAKGTMFLHLTIVKQALIGSVSPPPPMVVVCHDNRKLWRRPRGSNCGRTSAQRCGCRGRDPGCGQPRRY
jgi:hypothetical protein